MTPRVSVIIPNFNHARFLDQRLRSVQEQTFGDFEIIFLDDASTDDSRAVFQRHADDPRVAHAVFHETNSGCPFVQWNRGLRLARGEYVWIAESDDYARLTLLEELVAILDRDPGVGIAMCRSYLVDETGRESLDWWPMWLRACTQKDQPEDGRWPGEVVCTVGATTSSPVCNASSVVFRRAVAEAAGPADESFRLCGDWLFWVRVLEQSDLFYLAKPLNCFRWHGNSVRSASERAGLDVEEYYRVARYVASHFPVSRTARRTARMSLASRWGAALWASRHRIPLARQRHILREAIRFDPFVPWRLFRVWVQHVLRRQGWGRG